MDDGKLGGTAGRLWINRCGFAAQVITESLLSCLEVRRWSNGSNEQGYKYKSNEVLVLVHFYFPPSWKLQWSALLRKNHTRAFEIGQVEQANMKCESSSFVKRTAFDTRPSPRIQLAYLADLIESIRM